MATKKLKAGLDVPVDMSAFVIKTAGREVKPYDGEHVWLKPYMDSRTELEMVKARDALGENPDNATAFDLLCDTLAKLTLGWDLTDEYGDPLPEPKDADTFKALPSRAVFFLLNEALGVEQPGKDASG